MEISFQPVLQEIASLLSVSFINNEFFGKYWNIQYIFPLIQFNYNTLFEDAAIKMLKEITEDIMIEHVIDTPHYVIHKILDQPLQPAHQQRPFLYKEFQVGALNHVYSYNYGFGFRVDNYNEDFAYKSERPDTKIMSVNEETIFLLFKKGDKIGDCQTRFYLNVGDDSDRARIYISK